MKARRLAGPGHDHQLLLAMKAIYGYDPSKWKLGTLCIHGHAWPGTQQSLRRIGITPTCAACGSGSPHWLAGFIVGVEGGELPPGTRLGKPCKHGHTWEGTGWCLRKHSHCTICQPIQQLLDPAERRRRRIEAKRAARAAAGAKCVLELRNEYAYHRAIKSAGQCPSVARLVMNEQRRYWREHPDAFKAADNIRRKHQWRLQYLTDPELRRYNHEKSRRRKARLRGNHVIHVTTAQIRERFALFGHTCCYCGAAGDLHQEHFLPISKGGTHVLSNILPACQPCNYSKRDHNPEAWYRAQPFFTEQRWRRILTVLGKRRAPVGQLALL